MKLRAIIKKLITQGKFIELTATVKRIGETEYYDLPDTEIQKIIDAHPEYIRAGIDLFKIDGKKVWLPYYLTKGYFTEKPEMLLPVKVTPLFH